MVAKARMKNVVGLMEAARLTGLNPSRLRYLADAGRLPLLVDPVGRRLLKRDAVLQLARERADRRGQRKPLGYTAVNERSRKTQ